MDKRLQEMLDHYEITKVLSEYCHGLDRMDQIPDGEHLCQGELGLPWPKSMPWPPNS